MTDYALCGWRLSSEIALPELAPWRGDQRDSDVEIVFGTVSIDAATNLVLEGPDVALRIARDEAATLDIGGVGRFLVSNGRRIIIDPVPSTDEPAVRLYLLGSVLAMLSYQRGVLPLHASCLALDSGAVAITGDSGAGKSTLAATLSSQGATILADDVCVVDTSDLHNPLVWPTVSRVKLWHDALERLGVSTTGVERVRAGIDKYALYNATAQHTSPVPLAALYHLDRSAGGCGETPHFVSGIAAVKLLHRSVYRPSIAKAMGRESALTTAVMRILNTVPLFSISHNPAPTEVSPLAGVILEHQRSERVGAAASRLLPEKE